MQYERMQSRRNGGIGRAAIFSSPGGTSEVHLCIVPGGRGGFRDQLRSLVETQRTMMRELALPPDSTVFQRFFLSDAAHQGPRLRDEVCLGESAGTGPIATSMVEQPPLPARALALWSWHFVDGVPLEKSRRDQSVALARGESTHIWTTGLHAVTAIGDRASDSGDQTDDVFREWSRQLDEGWAATIRDHGLRTWLFVRDIDRHYRGMVAARRTYFESIGLTSATHYLASTGIEGRSGESSSLIMLDGYAVKGLAAGQVTYLAAGGHLGRTDSYGVTFERGTAVSYRDRRHLFISGTASIDANGDILHQGDVAMQCRRVLDNIAALLNAGTASLDDVASMIVYLRDHADRVAVMSILADTCPHVPTIVVLAPVCRTGWLVEIECVAVVRDDNPAWARL